MMYLKSICQYSFPGNMSFEDTIRLAREAGFDGYEIGLDPNGAVSPTATPDEIKSIRRKFDAQGVKVAGLICGYLWGYHPLSDHKEAREQAYQSVCTAMETALQFDLDRLSIISGTRSNPDGSPVSYETAFQRLMEFMARLAERGKELGVKILIENVWSRIMYSPLEAKKLVDQCPGQLGVHFDVANVLPFGEPEDWIRILGRRIGAIHFKDWRARIGNIEAFCPLLEGDVNFPAVMKALQETRYEGMISAEIPCTASPYQLVWLKQTSQAMDAILAGGA